ncbi:flavodoxin family protein [Sulfurovum zhangzhouensis]|nr:flavodoxin family protein [Sulfurovum zhangzhouensis]
MKVLAISGSYRSDGITEQVIKIMEDTLRLSGVEVETIMLREYPIEFCLNCRACTQEPGTAPGKCVQEDKMQELIEKMEEADALILASPTNFGTVTALFKRFMERLVAYAYWPWGIPTPQYRKNQAIQKKAVLVSSCAAPSILAYLFSDTIKRLKYAAKTIGAKTVGTMYIGLIAGEEHHKLSEGDKKRAEKLARKLL